MGASRSVVVWHSVFAFGRVGSWWTTMSHCINGAPVGRLLVPFGLRQCPSSLLGDARRTLVANDAVSNWSTPSTPTCEFVLVVDRFDRLESSVDVT